MEGRAGSIAVSLEPIEVPAGQGPHHVGPGRYARLSVADTGMGMSAATVERIFEPFFTTKPAGHGTGLGLSVVHGIVKAHEGEVAVRSVPGQGSTFEVYLPAVAAEISAPPAVAAAAPTAVRGRGEHILYLDDEAALVELAIRQLQRLGYRVSGFTEAPTALQAFRGGPEQFDIAITDFNMPGHSGLQVAKDLLTVRPDLPVVLTSGYVTDELREAAARLDIEVVYKPNTADELFEVIHRLINNAARSRTTR
jgi:CheY-like chemotaxis protein